MKQLSDDYTYIFCSTATMPELLKRKNACSTYENRGSTKAGGGSTREARYMRGKMKLYNTVRVHTKRNVHYVNIHTYIYSGVS